MNQHGAVDRARNNSPIQPSNGVMPKRSKELFKVAAELKLPAEVGGYWLVSEWRRIHFQRQLAWRFQICDTQGYRQHLGNIGNQALERGGGYKAGFVGGKAHDRQHRVVNAGEWSKERYRGRRGRLRGGGNNEGLEGPVD